MEGVPSTDRRIPLRSFLLWRSVRSGHVTPFPARANLVDLVCLYTSGDPSRVPILLTSSVRINHRNVNHNGKPGQAHRTSCLLVSVCIVLQELDIMQSTTILEVLQEVKQARDVGSTFHKASSFALSYLVICGIAYLFTGVNLCEESSHRLGKKQYSVESDQSSYICDPRVNSLGYLHCFCEM